jgi:hypothetical protein
MPGSAKCTSISQNQLKQPKSTLHITKSAVSTNIGIDMLNAYYIANFSSNVVAKLADDKPDYAYDITYNR